MSVDPAAALTRLGFDGSNAVIEDVAHNRWLTAGVWIVTMDDRRMVLKVISANAEAGDGTAWDAHWRVGTQVESRWNYWAREGLAYLAGLPDEFAAAGLVAPRLLASERAEGEIVLLLEFFEGMPGEEFAISDYADAAAALGRAQASFLEGRPMPPFPWLCRNFLRDYSTEKPVDWSLLDDDRAWDQPLVQRNFPTELRELAVWLHDSRDRLYEIVERLPRTVCHLDFWTKNLVRRAVATFGLFDWAFVGEGAIGEDVGNLVPDASFDHFIAADALPELQEAVREAHVQGLADAGWSGDPRLVELGMCAAAVKYDWLTPFMLKSAAADRHLGYGGVGEVDADHRFRERGLALTHNAGAARRAVELADQLGF